jgi:hypothetical protein
MGRIGSTIIVQEISLMGLSYQPPTLIHWTSRCLDQLDGCPQNGNRSFTSKVRVGVSLEELAICYLIITNQVSIALRDIQQDIKEGRKEEADIVHSPSISEKQAGGLCSAWQAYFIDRIEMEQHKVGWDNTASGLDYDLKFYRLLTSK